MDAPQPGQEEWKMHAAEQSLLLLLCIFLIGCAETQPPQPVFKHEINGPATPWNSEDFDNASSKFSFAIFSDLTGGERDRIFDVAIAQLALLRPEFIMNVGDLIEGAHPNKDSLAIEWNRFDARASRASAPVFYVGGNHDLTGEVLREVWAERLGKRYYHFVYKDVLFLILDTEDLTAERMRAVFTARRAAIEMMRIDPDSARKMKYFSMPERVIPNPVIECYLKWFSSVTCFSEPSWQTTLR